MNQENPPEEPKPSNAHQWVSHPLHPTRACFDGKKLILEQEVSTRFRVGPLLSTAVMAWLTRYTSWDGDEDNKTFWSVALTVMGDWDAKTQGLLQLVRGGDGRPGLRRKRKPGRIQNDLSVAWRGSRSTAAWLDVSTTAVIPLTLHYKPVAADYPKLWKEILTMNRAALMSLEGRSAYQLARVLNVLPEMEDSCIWCGATQNLTFDHAQPLDAGGAPWGDNLLTACQDCNQRKAAITLEDWLHRGHTPQNAAAVQRAIHAIGKPRPPLEILDPE